MNRSQQFPPGSRMVSREGRGGCLGRGGVVLVVVLLVVAGETPGYQRSVKTIMQSDISEMRPPGCPGNGSRGTSSRETAPRCAINDV